MKKLILVTLITIPFLLSFIYQDGSNIAYLDTEKIDDSFKGQLCHIDFGKISFGGQKVDTIEINVSGQRIRFYEHRVDNGYNNWFNEQTKRAETRQSFETLGYLKIRPNLPFQKIPSTSNQVKKFIHTLNWKSPWGASSHISHLMFFLKYNQTFFFIWQPNHWCVVLTSIRLRHIKPTS